MKYKINISKGNLKNILKNKRKYTVDMEEYNEIDEAIDASYIDKCKKENQEFVSIEDIDRLINGMYLSDDSLKELGIIKRYLEKLIIIVERSRIRDYMYLTDSKRRLFIINFIAGLGKGFGQAIGFTILAAIVISILVSWVDVPIIGKYIAQVLNYVQQYLK